MKKKLKVHKIEVGARGALTEGGGYYAKLKNEKDYSCGEDVEHSIIRLLCARALFGLEEKYCCTELNTSAELAKMVKFMLERGHAIKIEFIPGYRTREEIFFQK